MYAWIWRHLPGPWPVRSRARGSRSWRSWWRCCSVVFPWAEHVAAVPRRDGGRSDRPNARDRDPRRRQLRQLRLQPGAVPRPARRRVRRAAQRRGRRRTTRRGYDGVLLSPGPGTPETPASASTWSARCARRGAAARRLPRPPGDRRRVRRDGRARARAAARQDQPGATTRARASWPGCRRRSPRPATTRSPSSADSLPAELEVTGRTASGVVMALRHRDLPHRGRAVPPRVGAHRGRSPDARQLAGRPAATRRLARPPAWRRSSRRWPRRALEPPASRRPVASTVLRRRRRCRAVGGGRPVSAGAPAAATGDGVGHGRARGDSVSWSPAGSGPTTVPGARRRRSPPGAGHRTDEPGLLDQVACGRLGLAHHVGDLVAPAGDAQVDLAAAGHRLAAPSGVSTSVTALRASSEATG